MAEALEGLPDLIVVRPVAVAWAQPLTPADGKRILEIRVLDERDHDEPVLCRLGFTEEHARYLLGMLRLQGVGP